MLCNAYDDMSNFSARSKHQRCYSLKVLGKQKKHKHQGTNLPQLPPKVGNLDSKLISFFLGISP